MATALYAEYGSRIDRIGGRLDAASRSLTEGTAACGARACCIVAISEEPALAGDHSHIAPSSSASGWTETSCGNPVACRPRSASCKLPLGSWNPRIPRARPAIAAIEVLICHLDCEFIAILLLIRKVVRLYT